MLESSDLINRINEKCKVFFMESTFHIQPYKTNTFRLTGSYTSKAINNYKNEREEVNVIKWFNDFWVFLEIRFQNENKFISISIFQGEVQDNSKIQLFRAEWDDYNSLEEKHPQPHWHLTGNQAIENTFEEYASTFEEDGFTALLEEEKSKIIDLHKLHFAMSSDWLNSNGHVHPINNVDKISNWFAGLLSHIKDQLDYSVK